MRDLVRLACERHQVEDEQLTNVVDMDPEDVWRRIEAEADDLGDVVDAAARVAEVDGPISSRKKSVLGELRDRGGRS